MTTEEIKKRFAEAKADFTKDINAVKAHQTRLSKALIASGVEGVPVPNWDEIKEELEAAEGADPEE